MVTTNEVIQRAIQKQDPVAEFLEHHGVKGQKWGVRRAAKKVAKGDKKWQKNIYSIHGAIAVHNHVADAMNNGGLASLNKKYEGKTVFNNDGSPHGAVGKAYMKDFVSLNEKLSAQAVKEVHGTSPSGMTAKLDTSGSQWKVVVTQGAAQHAASDWEDLEIEVDHDASGKITMAASVMDAAAQSALTDEFLEHHGVRGMKWGVRKRSTSSGPANVTPKVNVKSLSDAELKAHINRMNLEQQFKTLSTPKKKEAHDFVKGLGKTAISTVVSSGVAFGVAKALKKVAK